MALVHHTYIPTEITVENIKDALKEVYDPEIPALSVIDLGMITQIDTGEAFIVVTMTPTFAGCPAVDHIRHLINAKLKETFPEIKVEVKVDFSATWTSNLITDQGKTAIKTFGIAPPQHFEGEVDPGQIAHAQCPWCGSEHTTMRSAFGPTLCRAVHYCFDCMQSFEQFKPL